MQYISKAFTTNQLTLTPKRPNNTCYQLAVKYLHARRLSNPLEILEVEGWMDYVVRVRFLIRLSDEGELERSNDNHSWFAVTI
ncbi:hypothetical protein C0W66_22780 [Photobacterium kishitanii]|nr:hypothetical protein AYY23_21720 [Photobacterium kishitanii]PSW44953.1 hypothetical protein C0W66_22780 [Photobacterium kishitanii]